MMIPSRAVSCLPIARQTSARVIRHVPSVGRQSARFSSINQRPTSLLVASHRSQTLRRFDTTRSHLTGGYSRLQSTLRTVAQPESSTLPPSAAPNNGLGDHLFTDPIPDGSGIPPVPVDEPYVGYLRDLGLDFGWGPSSTMQWLFEHIHVYAGTPFWGSVVLLAITYRIGVFGLLLRSADASARMRAVQPIIAPLSAQMKEAAQVRDTLKMSQLREQVQRVYRESGVKPQYLLLPFLQMPFGFGVWRLLRNMADVPVPGLATGGTLWFQNLAVADPYMILPLVTSTCMFFQFKLGGETGAQSTANPAVLGFFKYVLPPVTFLIFMNLPAIVIFSFATNALIALLTAYLLRSPAFRRLFKLAPLWVPKVGVNKSASSMSFKEAREQGFRKYMSNKWEEAKSSMPETASKSVAQTAADKRFASEKRLQNSHQSRADSYTELIKNQSEARRQAGLQQNPEASGNVHGAVKRSSRRAR